MSILTTAEFGDQELDIEIFHDGRLEFVDYDIEHDEAALEFGYPETPAIRIKRLWNRNAPETIAERIPMLFEHLILLAADWAEHTVHIYGQYWEEWEWGAEENCKKNQLELARALKYTRAYIKSTGQNEAMRHELFIMEKVIDAIRSEQSEGPAKQSARAVWNALNAAQAWTARSATPNVGIASEAAANAAGMSCATKPGDTRVVVPDEQARRLEMLWQVRRFVDCMEAVGSNKPWPPMKATP